MPYAKKKFGQNFLTDPNVIAKIIQAIHPQAEEPIVEIGPGHGALTAALLQKTGKLEAIEIDKDIIPNLIAHCAGMGDLNIHSQDVLKFDFSTLIKRYGKLRLVGNLPYNIATPLLFKLLKYKDAIIDMHFMLQKEVVERICAQPNNKHYGRLSVMMQCYFETAALFNVSANCFTPKPNVESAIIKLTPRPQDNIDNGDALVFEKTVKAAFAQRRKTLRNTMKSILSAEQLNANQIDPSRRAETLSVDDFSRLSRFIHQRNAE